MDYTPTTDKAGTPLQPGDRVSFKTYPRGTLRGTVVIHPRETDYFTKLPTLAIESNGVLYPLYRKGVTKLKKQT